MATLYCAFAILLLSNLCHTTQGFDVGPQGGSESVRAFLDLWSADVIDAASWEDFQYVRHPQLAFLGGLVTKTAMKCKKHCNNEDFFGDTCEGYFSSRCRTKFPVANGKVKAVEVNKCTGTFKTQEVRGNGTFRRLNTCQGFRKRRNTVNVTAGLEGLAAKSTWECGLFNNEEVTLTENPFDLEIKSSCEGSQHANFKLLAAPSPAPGPAPAPAPPSWMGNAQEIFADMPTGNRLLELRNGAGGGSAQKLSQLLDIADATCNGVDISFEAPCQGLYELTVQRPNAVLKQECSGSYTTLYDQEFLLFGVVSNCQGEGKTDISFEGSVFSMTATDTCSTNDSTMSAIAQIFGGVFGATSKLCLGNSTSTQHFATINGGQPLIV